MEISAVALQVRQFIEDSFLFGQSDGFRDQDSFLEGGIIDSTGILELIAFLQREYGIQVDDEEAVPDNLDSVDRVAAYVCGKLSSADGGSRREADSGL